MDLFTDLITNKVLMSAVAAWFIAQCSKNLLLLAKGEFTADRITGGGGMPSAHSATVTGLCTASLIVYGPGSYEFAISLFFAIIVIYDAMGVRFETGREAAALNKLRKQQIDEGKDPLYDKPMQETMGHTFPEIVVGCLVGILSAILVCWLIGKFA